MNRKQKKKLVSQAVKGAFAGGGLMLVVAAVFAVSGENRLATVLSQNAIAIYAFSGVVDIVTDFIF